MTLINGFEADVMRVHGGPLTRSREAALRSMRRVLLPSHAWQRVSRNDEIKARWGSAQQGEGYLTTGSDYSFTRHNVADGRGQLSGIALG